MKTIEKPCKRQKRRDRGRVREEINIAKRLYKEPSCATCRYATWDKWFDGETHHTEVGCNYPFKGDLGTYKERIKSDLLYHWHYSLTDAIEECDSGFKLVD